MGHFMIIKEHMRIYLYALVALLFFAAGSAQAKDMAGDDILQPLHVTADVYYLKGSIDARSYENYSLNNNLGFVVTSEGGVLLDSGASHQSGPLIEQLIATVTDLPVRWVINTGSQDHRWMGNGYFASRGAQIIALAWTVETQKHFADSHLQRSSQILRDRFEGTVPVYAAQPLEGDRHQLTLGGVEFELFYVADAHFPGDIQVWLPQHEVVFTGDVVYVDRIVGIHPWSDVRGLQKNFVAMEALRPRFVIPGHGMLCDLEKARAESGDYYDFLLEHVARAVEEFVGMSETVETLGDAPQFAHLAHYDSWHRLNINRTYLQLEAE